MKKTLKDLTREDWNALFPLKLVPHNPVWKRIYEAEKKLILEAVGAGSIVRIEHFGSSSIPRIQSKPYIDMMVEVPKGLLFDEELIQRFETIGYSHFEIPARENIEAYSTFVKGYQLEGPSEQIFHIHMCPSDNWMWRQIEFRDYLNANEQRALEYEQLKLALFTKFKDDRVAYRIGKTQFIHDTLAMVDAEK